EALWDLVRNHPKNYVRRTAEKYLGDVLALDVAPYPDGRENLRAWLGAEDQKALQTWLKTESMRRGGIDGADFKTLSALEGRARLAFITKLREIYDRERNNLAWSADARQFHPKGRP